MQKPIGYPTGYGWRGWVANEQRWMLFVSEEEYIEYISDD